MCNKSGLCRLVWNRLPRHPTPFWSAQPKVPSEGSFYICVCLLCHLSMTVFHVEIRGLFFTPLPNRKDWELQLISGPHGGPIPLFRHPGHKRTGSDRVLTLLVPILLGNEKGDPLYTGTPITTWNKKGWWNRRCLPAGDECVCLRWHKVSGRHNGPSSRIHNWSYKAFYSCAPLPCSHRSHKRQQHYRL